MPLETLRGRLLHQVLAEARTLFGEDALIVNTRSCTFDGQPGVELQVATSESLQRLSARLEPISEDVLRPAPGTHRPRVVALVGPTGSGKTTTAVKLAVHPRVYGDLDVGFVSLDTFRVGAIEQLGTYATVAGAPLEVLYKESDVADAMRRLAGCDVVVVDTPGRTLHTQAENAEWTTLLRRLQPDEVHLVIPAHARVEAAAHFFDRYGACDPTHLLLTKLDELSDGFAADELALRLEIPCRWVCDGQSVPSDLHPARSRLWSSVVGSMGALGSNGEWRVA